MSDEAQATPETGNSAEQAQENWEQRFKDTQAGFTKSQQELATERQVWDDEQAALARLAEKFPHLFEEADPEPDPDEYVDPDEAERPMTVAEYERRERERDERAEAQQRAQSAEQQFEADFKAVLDGREITKHGDRAIRYALNQGEIKNADDLKKAVDEYFEEATPAKAKPRVPHAVTGGQAATQVPVWSEMTQGEQNRRMTEMVMEREAQT